MGIPSQLKHTNVNQFSLKHLITYYWQTRTKKYQSVKNFNAYVGTTNYKWKFKQLCILFFKKEIELQQHSSSKELRTWTMVISINLSSIENEIIVVMPKLVITNA